MATTRDDGATGAVPRSPLDGAEGKGLASRTPPVGSANDGDELGGGDAEDGRGPVRERAVTGASQRVSIVSPATRPAALSLRGGGAAKRAVGRDDTPGLDDAPDLDDAPGLDDAFGLNDAPACHVAGVGAAGGPGARPTAVGSIACS